MGFLTNVPLHPYCPRRVGVHLEHPPHVPRESPLHALKRAHHRHPAITWLGGRFSFWMQSWSTEQQLNGILEIKSHIWCNSEDKDSAFNLSFCMPPHKYGNSFFHWKYAFGQWWNRWLMKRQRPPVADDEAALCSSEASGHWQCAQQHNMKTLLQ